MLQCWEFDPKNRPTFSNLVQSLSQSLEAMAGYMDIGAFGGSTPNPNETTTSNSGNRDDSKDHDDSLEREPAQSQESESQEVVITMGTICDETRV